MYTTLMFSLGILCLLLIPFMPKLIRLRIRILRWIHWNWAANLLERNFDSWVLIFRVAVLAIASVLLYLGWDSLPN